MTPQVRYTKSADGVHIAYWAIGDGLPIVYLPAVPFSHIQLEWDLPDCRRWYERLVSAGHTLVRYDARGTGLSDRDATDYSLEAYMGDLRAVVDTLGLQKFALFAMGDIGMAAIAWAVANPDRVSHLVLWSSYANRASVTSPQSNSLRVLVEQDWLTYTETAARVILGWSGMPEEAATFAEFYRACTTQDVVLAVMPGVYTWDVADQLEQLQCPALVIQRRDMPAVSPEVARDLAKRIPNGQLALLDGKSPIPFLGDERLALQTILSFLGGDSAAAAAVADSAGSASVTILFTDMEGSTALTQRLGDVAAQEVVRTHDRIVRDALGSHGGTEVKHTGDGLMVSFPSATNGVECAVAIQQKLAAFAEDHPEKAFRVRVGLNAGEPVAEHGDYFGTAVQLAARICQLAQPGQILVSGVVRDLTAGKRFLFADLGETAPRGFEDPVHLYEVRWSP